MEGEGRDPTKGWEIWEWRDNCDGMSGRERWEKKNGRKRKKY